MKLNIVINSKRVKFNFTFEHRISYIVGDSGTGKTRFVKALMDTSGVYDKSFSIPVRCIELTETNWDILVSSNYNETVMFVVDDKDFVRSVNFSKCIKDIRNAFFVFIIRSGSLLSSIKDLSTLSVHGNAIYNITVENETHVLRRYYNYKDKMPCNVDAFLCEDSKSGFIFFKSLYNNGNVISLKGRDNAIRFIEDNEKLLKTFNTVVLFVDYSAIGFKIELMEAYLNLLGVNVYIYPTYESFEYMLLNSNMFNDVEYDYSNYLQYSSHEDMYTSLLEGITSGKVYSYSKSSDFKTCYYEDCCTVNRKHLNCDRGISGDKMEGLLLGSKFNFLLELR